MTRVGRLNKPDQSIAHAWRYVINPGAAVGFDMLWTEDVRLPAVTLDCFWGTPRSGRRSHGTG